MRAVTDTPKLFEELAYREADGLEISLLWNRADAHLSVYIYDRKTSEVDEVPAPAEHALEVFRHPFAYAATA